MKSNLPKNPRTPRTRRTSDLPATPSLLAGNPPDPREVEQFAQFVWHREGARPGLLAQYRHEVESQLRLTRHLLAGEELPVLSNRHPHCA